MNQATAGIQTMHPAVRMLHFDYKRTLCIAALALAAVIPAVAQGGGELQEKLAMVKEASAANKQRLQQYQWTETTQLTLKGDAKPPSQSMCQYGPDGTVQKTPMGPPPPPPSGGRMKQRIIEKKTEEIKEYMGQVKQLLAMYVPPDSQRMQQAFQSGNASFVPNGSGDIQLVFKNYAQQGDQMTLSFNTSAKKISTVSVNTYMGESKDVVTLRVQMGSLPDGTNYAQQINLDATAKQLQVAITNSNYQKLGGQ
jgi:hypothetical protein